MNLHRAACGLVVTFLEAFALAELVLGRVVELQLPASNVAPGHVYDVHVVDVTGLGVAPLPTLAEGELCFDTLTGTFAVLTY